MIAVADPFAMIGDDGPVATSSPVEAKSEPIPPVVLLPVVHVPAAAIAADAPATPASTPAPSTDTQATSPAVAVTLPKSRAKKQILTFDLETIPDESRMHLFGLDPLPTPSQYLSEAEGFTPSELVTPKRADEKPATLDDIKAAVETAIKKADGKKLNRKVLVRCLEIESQSAKPRKGVKDIFEDLIAAIDNEGAMIAAATVAQRKKMSVTPEMCRIAAFGWSMGNDAPQSMVVGQPKADGTGIVEEVDILERFWMLASSASSVCGYNVLGFDLWVIFMRSAILKVKPSRKFDMKPWGEDVIDLMKKRFPAGPAIGLGPLCKMLGIVSALPDVDGSQVETLFRENPAKLGEYVRDDVSLSKGLLAMWSGYFA